MPVVDSFTNSCINMLPDKLSGKKPVVWTITFSYPTMSVSDYFQAGLGQTSKLYCYNTVLELTKCMFVIASSKFLLFDRQTNSQSKDIPNKIYSLNNSTFIYNHTVVILI